MPTVCELKIALKKKGLAVSGNKAVLEARLKQRKKSKKKAKKSMNRVMNKGVTKGTKVPSNIQFS